MITDAKNILVINLRYIGDTIWMYPFIRNLKHNMPEAKITALVNEGGALLELMEELTEVIAIPRKELKGKGGLRRYVKLLGEVRAKRFDTVFILSNNDRSTFIGFVSGAKRRIGFLSGSRFRASMLTQKSRWTAEGDPHMIRFFLQLLTDSGLKIRETALTIPVPEELREATKKRFSITGERKTVIVHPGARMPLRQWGSENFIKVINELSGSYRIILAGGPGDREVVDTVLKGLDRPPDAVTTDTTLLEFAALCSISDIFIGNDSAPIHIAAGAGAFVVGIYGPTIATHCGPWTDRKLIFDDETVPCKLCKQERCTGEEFKACFKEITAEVVLKKLREALSTSA